MDKQARTLSILGDSYSTFKGWLPEGNYIYYPNENVPDMTRAEDTWWQLLIAKRGFRMLINDSSSGTTVSTSVRPEHVISDAFVMRMKNSLSENGVNGEKPDCILLFGGTDKLVECHMERLLTLVLWGKSDVGFHTGLEAVALFQS